MKLKEHVENLFEKAKSEQQRKLMAMAYAHKVGELKDKDVSEEVLKLSKDMSEEELKKFASK